MKRSVTLMNINWDSIDQQEAKAEEDYYFE